MYVPSIHKSKQDEDVYEYIRRNGFATLVSVVNDRQVATHIPMYLDKTGDSYKLISHISRANDQKESFDGSQELLAIFMESHAYVSSSWYDHINVPTWNYIAVHIYGKARILEGKELQDSIGKLVEQYESGRTDRFHLSDMSEDMKNAHFKGIVGFEMSIDRLESSYKLSQNRNEKDYQNVIAHLEKDENHKSHHIADAMKKLRS